MPGCNSFLLWIQRILPVHINCSVWLYFSVEAKEKVDSDKRPLTPMEQLQIMKSIEAGMTSPLFDPSENDLKVDDILNMSCLKHSPFMYRFALLLCTVLLCVHHFLFAKL